MKYLNNWQNIQSGPVILLPFESELMSLKLATLLELLRPEPFHPN